MIDLNLAREHFRSERFRDKLASALAITTKALSDSNKPYVAFSGGVDSTAVEAVVHRLSPYVPMVWSDDELELPETVSFMSQIRSDFDPLMLVTYGWAQHAGWFTPWADEPYWRDPLPGTLRINKAVDDWQAERGYDLVFTGVRMDESDQRRGWLMRAGPIYNVRDGVGRRCCPLWDWTKDDVWALVAGWYLAYNHARL